MEKHIFPNFTDLEFSEYEIKYCQNLRIILRNVVRTYTVYDTTVESLVKLVTKISLPDNSNEIGNDARLMQGIQAPALHMYNYFIYCLDLVVKNITIDNMVKTGRALINVATYVCKDLLRTGLVDELIYMLKKIGETVILVQEVMNTLINLLLMRKIDGFKDVIKAFKKPKCQEYLEECGLLINNLVCAMELYKSDSENCIGYIEFCKNLSEILTESKINCCCKIYYNVYGCINALLIITDVINDIIENNKSEDVYKKIGNLFMTACRHVDVVRLEECKQFKYMWKLVYCRFYNYLVRLFRLKIACGKTLLHKLIIVVYKMEGLETETSPSMFDMLAEYYFIDQQNEIALKLIALNIVVFPHHAENALNQWLKVKAELGHEHWLKTVVQVYNDCLDYYKTFYPDLKVLTCKQTKIDILKKELNVLVNRWPKRVAIGAALDELWAISSPTDFARAVLTVGISQSCKLPKNTTRILLECANNIKVSTNETKVLKASLLFLYFKCKDAEIVADAYSAYTEKDNVLINASTSCDLDNYAANLKYLRQAACLFHSIHFRNLNGLKLDLLLQEMAFTLQVQCLHEDAINVWQVLLEYAIMDDNAEFVITSAGFLLRYLDTKHGDFKSVLNKVKRFLNTLNSHSEEDLILCKYYTNVCFAYLFNGDIKSFKQTFELTSEYYFKVDSKRKDKKVDIVCAYYMLLEAQILNIPCEQSTSNHEDNTLIKPYLALKTVRTHLQNHDNSSSFTIYVYWEIIDFTLRTSAWMRWPREIYCYGNDNVARAQLNQYIFRAAWVLIYLGKANILTCALDDCSVVLQRLSELLAIKSVRKEQNADQLYSNTAQPIKSEQGSPILFTNSFKTPNFIHHDTNCDCIPCNSSEYVKLLLEKMHLEAMLSECHKNLGATSEYYDGIFNIIDLKTKDSCGALNSLIFNLDSSCDFVQLEFIKYKLRTGSNKIARQLNETLLEKIQSNSTKNYFLYNEILNLQMIFLMFEKFPEEEIKELSPQTPEELAALEEGSNQAESRFLFKTPKITMVPLSKIKIYTPATEKTRKQREPKSHLKIEREVSPTLSPTLERRMNKLTLKLTSTKKADENKYKLRPELQTTIRKNLFLEMGNETPIKTKTENANGKKTFDDFATDLLDVVDCNGTDEQSKKNKSNYVKIKPSVQCQKSPEKNSAPEITITKNAEERQKHTRGAIRKNVAITKINKDQKPKTSQIAVPKLLEWQDNIDDAEQKSKDGKIKVHLQPTSSNKEIQTSTKSKDQTKRVRSAALKALSKGNTRNEEDSSSKNTSEIATRRKR